MAPIETLAQRLAAVAETLRLSELVDFVVESSRVGGQDTFAGCLYLVDPGVSRVSCLEHGAIRAIDALPGTSCTRHGARTNRAVRRRHRPHRRCLPRLRGEGAGFKPSEDVPGFR